jgi:transposase
MIAVNGPSDRKWPADFDRRPRQFCRPIAFLLTAGQVADCIAADVLLEQMPATRILHGDKSYDSHVVRRKIESKVAELNIPPKLNRRWKNCFSPYLYRDRNAIERIFTRINDFRRIATGMTNSPKTSLLPSVSPQPSATG